MLIAGWLLRTLNVWRLPFRLGPASVATSFAGESHLLWRFGRGGPYQGSMAHQFPSVTGQFRVPVASPHG